LNGSNGIARIHAEWFRDGFGGSDPSKLYLDERVEHCGPLAFEVAVLLETHLKQSFDSLHRFGPG
jgi:hypothetical protein